MIRNVMVTRWKMKKKFSDAFTGLLKGTGHRSILTQYILAAMAVCAGFVLHLRVLEWVAVIVCIGLVITAEILNTCIEKLCDLYSTDYSNRIREIKDLAAGAVLAASLTAFVTAMVILFSHIGG